MKIKTIFQNYLVYFSICSAAINVVNAAAELKPSPTKRKASCDGDAPGSPMKICSPSPAKRPKNGRTPIRKLRQSDKSNIWTMRFHSVENDFSSYEEASPRNPVYRNSIKSEENFREWNPPQVEGSEGKEFNVLVVEGHGAPSSPTDGTPPCILAEDKKDQRNPLTIHIEPALFLEKIAHLKSQDQRPLYIFFITCYSLEFVKSLTELGAYRHIDGFLSWNGMVRGRESHMYHKNIRDIFEIIYSHQGALPVLEEKILGQIRIAADPTIEQLDDYLRVKDRPARNALREMGLDPAMPFGDANRLAKAMLEGGRACKEEERAALGPIARTLSPTDFAISGVTAADLRPQRLRKGQQLNLGELAINFNLGGHHPVNYIYDGKNSALKPQ